MRELKIGFSVDLCELSRVTNFVPKKMTTSVF